MRIRTRHRLFWILVALGVLNYLFFLYDILLNASAFFWVVLGIFAAMIVVGLILYLGAKPDVARRVAVPGTLDVHETAEASIDDDFGYEPTGARRAVHAETIEATEVVETPKPRPTGVEAPTGGPHFYRCPSCVKVFSMEATHLSRRRDVRLSCPHCRQIIRVPAEPELVVGEIPAVDLDDREEAVYQCQACGEVLRFRAPTSMLTRRLMIQSCPNCGASGLSRATAGP